ncbi:MAG: hypothetical protein LDL31_01825, partial [Prosthecobacter sp.]|nr:hypothetical protein [Prosthecobacter sp.]
MTTACCPNCNWDFETYAPAGTTVGCEQCGQTFQISYPTATYNPTLEVQRPRAFLEKPAPAQPAPPAPPQPALSAAPVSTGTYPLPARSSARMPAALPPFPLELSLTFSYVLMAGANGTCSFTLRNTSAQTVSRVQLSLNCEALLGGRLLHDHDPLAPGEEVTDVLDLGRLDPDVHGPTVILCTLRAGTPEGIRYAEGKLAGIHIEPITASGRDISLKIGDNFALGAEGVNINVGPQENVRELLKHRIANAPALPVPLRQRPQAEAAHLPHHFTNTF